MGWCSYEHSGHQHCSGLAGSIQKAVIIVGGSVYSVDLCKEIHDCNVHL